MKKYALFICILVISTIAVFANDTRFSNALKSCTSYSEYGTVNADGMQVDVHKQILGWENNKCVYKEALKFSGIDTVVTCRFSKPQINELYSVMQAYEVVSKYSGKDVDTSSVEGAQNNPVVKAWNKYIQDSSVCSMSGLGQ